MSELLRQLIIVLNLIVAQPEEVKIILFALAGVSAMITVWVFDRVGTLIGAIADRIRDRRIEVGKCIKIEDLRQIIREEQLQLFVGEKPRLLTKREDGDDDDDKEEEEEEDRDED